MSQDKTIFESEDFSFQNLTSRFILIVGVYYMFRWIGDAIDHIIALPRLRERTLTTKAKDTFSGLQALLQKEKILLPEHAVLKINLDSSLTIFFPFFGTHEFSTKLKYWVNTRLFGKPQPFFSDNPALSYENLKREWHLKISAQRGALANWLRRAYNIQVCDERAEIPAINPWNIKDFLLNSFLETHLSFSGWPSDHPSRAPYEFRYHKIIIPAADLKKLLAPRTSWHAFVQAIYHPAPNLEALHEDLELGLSPDDSPLALLRSPQLASNTDSIAPDHLLLQISKFLDIPGASIHDFTRAQELGSRLEKLNKKAPSAFFHRASPKESKLSKNPAAHFNQSKREEATSLPPSIEPHAPAFPAKL